MLAPQDRHLLLESLRPPDGYSVDQALGTTFSLDLTALLLPPLAFALFDREDRQGPIGRDPLALLEAVRRYADRISLFCQAGQIHVPRVILPIHTYLEGSVFEVKLSDPDHVFHPKVWILRMAAENRPVLYRLLSLSRNLTFDRSWDTVLVLEGEVANRRTEFRGNGPLADFVRALPGWALRPLPERLDKQIALIAEEIARVQFELPEGFESVAYWPLGLGTRRRPLREDAKRLLVVSPFLSATTLSDLASRAKESILVSRVEALDELPAAGLEPFGRIFTMSEAAAPAAEDQEAELSADPPLRGLHAKLYVTETGFKASLWTGSPNATVAAFNGNVEFLVELVGPKRLFGIDAILAQGEGQTGFGNLLEKYNPGTRQSQVDEVLAAIECIADAAVRQVASSPLVCHIAPSEDAQQFRVELRCEIGSVVIDSAISSLSCRPVTLPPAAAQPFQGNATPCAVFPRVSFEGLTSFFAFELTARDRGRSASRRFVLNLLLHGAPADRRERVLRSMLRTKADVTRFILLLLAESGSHLFDSGVPGDEGNGEPPGSLPRGAESSLFESLVRALEQDPVRLDAIDRVVRDLRKTGEGDDRLPDGFDSIWGPLWTARERMRK